MEESEQQAYRCSVCLDNFENPKVIPCGHTFCLGCLQQLPTQYVRCRKSLQCPKCRREVDLPSSGRMEDFATNFAIMGAIELSIDGALQNLCVKHKKKQELYCNTCRACICVECFVLKHKSEAHDVTSSTVQADITIEQLGSAEECFKESRFTVLFDRISEMEENNAENARALLRRIEEVRENMIEEINRQADQLTKFVEAVTEDKKEEFEKRKQSIEKKNNDNLEKAKQCSLLVEEISKFGLSQERFEKGRDLCDIQEKDYIESDGKVSESDGEDINDHYTRHFDVYHVSDEDTPTEEVPLCDDDEDKCDDKHNTTTDEEFVSSSIYQLEQLNNLLEFEENPGNSCFVFGVVKQSESKLVNEEFCVESIYSS